MTFALLSILREARVGALAFPGTWPNGMVEAVTLGAAWRPPSNDPIVEFVFGTVGAGLLVLNDADPEAAGGMILPAIPWYFCTPYYEFSLIWGMFWLIWNEASPICFGPAKPNFICGPAWLFRAPSWVVFGPAVTARSGACRFSPCGKFDPALLKLPAAVNSADPAPACPIVFFWFNIVLLDLLLIKCYMNLR